ncbi:MAG: disulfide bond formation protein B [Pseudomonadota bacterium]
MNRPYLNSATNSALCLAILLSSMALSGHFGYDPCLLCLIQRALFGLLAIVFALAALWLKGRRIADVIGLFFCLLGICTAGQQLALHYLPVDPTAVRCSASWEVMFQALPWWEFMQWFVEGAATDCASESNYWFGLPLAGWSFMGFVGVAGIIVARLVTKHAK